MIKMNSVGTFRSLNNRYFDFKKQFQNINPSAKKAKKQSLNESSENLTENSGKDILLVGKTKQGPLELQHWNLPPRYMEIFDNTTDIFKEIQLKFTRLQEEQQKRITPRFNEEENVKLDRIIRELIYDLTRNVKNCDDNIKEIAYINVDNQTDSAVKNNMRLFLAAKLGEYTKAIRNNEESYIRKYQELVGDITKFTHSSSKAGLSGDPNIEKDPQLFLQIESTNDTLKKRDTEINNLVNSINELGSIFKDLQTLIFEQGTILDRIDFNIEKSLEHTKKGNEDLLESEKNLKNNCARNSIVFMITLIFVLAILLLLKFTSKA